MADAKTRGDAEGGRRGRANSASPAGNGHFKFGAERREGLSRFVDRRDFGWKTLPYWA